MKASELTNKASIEAARDADEAVRIKQLPPGAQWGAANGLRPPWTRFDLKDISIRGSRYMVWVDHKGEGIARFDGTSPKRKASAFVKFLVINFTTEEFYRLAKKGYDPIDILKTKGFGLD